MQEIIGHILFLLLVIFIFRPMIYFFISDKNNIEQNIDKYERKNNKSKELKQ